MMSVPALISLLRDVLFLLVYCLAPRGANLLSLYYISPPLRNVQSDRFPLSFEIVFDLSFPIGVLYPSLTSRCCIAQATTSVRECKPVLP